ncbi:spliceosome-associated protein CWC27 homolog [Macrobrachium nipponense]|uniref:spliceosome-associated protein CWC27 homolog n=1 Tax=Macrobrachium nipponense TaxID=159736 RepID=UPI0030C7A858
MSNIYIQEPATEGKVLLVTSAGDFDIELWSREAPKACQNFVQLCLEGYYNGTIFHRVVPGFIVQGGDPTGTGEGGESVYGKPFRDEFHSRLRFVRRGLVAMANAGPNDNGSQFFFTLGPCPELQNKHTVFGKITGDTIYNLPRFEEGEIGKDDRPEYPHKIVKTEVLNNPFPDITPRMKIENEIPREERRKKKKGTKNFKLLSFGDEAEEEEEEVLAATKSFTTKGNSAHDIAMDPTLSASTGNKKEGSASEAISVLKQEVVEEDTEGKENEDTGKEDEKEVIKTAEMLEEEKKIKMEDVKAQIKQLTKELKGKILEAEEIVEKKEEEEEESDSIREYKLTKAKYEEERKKLPRKGTTREQQTLALLQRFSAKVAGAFNAGSDSDEEKETYTNDDDDDDSWIRHKFHFEDAAPVLARDASTKDDNWYDMNDPRNPLNKRRRDELPKSKKPRN